VPVSDEVLEHVNVPSYVIDANGIVRWLNRRTKTSPRALPEAALATSEAIRPCSPASFATVLGPSTRDRIRVTSPGR
jgi:hypothetical protein